MFEHTFANKLFYLSDLICGLLVQLQVLSVFGKGGGSLNQIYLQVHCVVPLSDVRGFFTYQSIKQSIKNCYSANIPGVAKLSGVTSKSVFNSKIDEAVPQHQQVIGHAGVYGGEARSKRDIS